MLPVGILGIRIDENNNYGTGRKTNFSRNEQVMMMSLWCMFRSPLMVGCELTKMDEWTLKILTNKEVLRILNSSYNGHQVYRENDKIVWYADDVDGSSYLGFFNLSESKEDISVYLREIGLNSSYKARDLWRQEEIGSVQENIEFNMYPHSCKLIKLYK